MYEVLLGSQILYYPGSDDYVIYDTELNLDVGSAGEFLFKVPSSNPLYNSLSMGTLVTILKNGAEYWRGEIRDIKIDFAKVADVYCLEDLAWLGEEYMAPAKVINQTYTQRFTTAVTTYNANRSNDRKFTVGYVYNGSGTCNWRTEYEWSILDSIRNCICRDDYYVRVRRVTNGGTVTRYLDVVRLEDYGVAANQPIEYGYNLLDYVKDSDYGNLVNVLTPYGDVKTDAADNPVYVYDDYMEHIQGTTISNQASIAAYGRHAKAVVFDGVTNVTSLNNLASAYLARYCQPQLTMEVSAVDLAEIENVDAINIGDSVLIIAKPFAVNQRLYLTQMTIDLQNIAKNKITLSGHVARRTLTNQLQTAMDAVEELPVESDILMTAKRNALAMLLDETQGGHVVFEYDTSNKYVEAINICNAATINSSTKRWRWSANGFGYMERANTSAEWSGATAKIAITMNGAIVADYITTGSMSATRIRGGVLYLGGSGQGDYKNGSLRLYNASDALIGIWDISGITLYDGNGTAAANVIGYWYPSGISVKKGTITLGGKASLSDTNTGVYVGSDGIGLGANSPFKVTNAGKLTATDADITGKITATSGSFSGSLSAATGTFAGSLSAATGTFAGSLSAATGSFTGSVTATSGSIGGVNIANNQSEHGIDSGLGADDAVKMVRESGFMWAHINGSTWGKFNTLLNSPPHATESLAITTYIHNGHLCVDNDGTLSDDGDHATNQIFVSPYNVSKWANGSTDQVIWVNTSDARLKKDIEDIEVEEIEDFFGKIKPKKFRYNEKSAESSKPLHYGVIAQEVIEAFGDSGEEFDYTDQNKEGFYHVHYMEFHGMELAGIKELMNTVKEQQKEIDLLREEIKAMKEVING